MSTTIETITVTRPMKVIAFTCCAITVFLMIASVSCSQWVTSDGWREGLFVQCVEEGAPTPLPFGAKLEPGCHRAHSAGYVRGTAALIVICVMTDFFGTLLTGLGLRSTDPNKKYKYYRVAIYSLLVACIALFLALIIYPVSFSKEIDDDVLYDGGKVTFAKNFGSLDFDNDGILDHIDDDDDNDGIKDDLDDDDDNDGIKDKDDDDDDNDGIPDTEDGDDDDFDNDGTPDHLDDDDDGDGVPDHIDNDDDNDGIIDSEDDDDDNDGIIDSLDNDSDGDGTVDALDNDDDNDGIEDSLDTDDDNDGQADSADGDRDGDGIADHLDNDDDNDGIADHLDDDDDNDGIPDVLEGIDSDNDGTPDHLDKDDDGDGTPDDIDDDDDNDGIPDDEDYSGKRREWEFSFGYGAGWFCAILLFSSVALLICDRESEEIFYKERPVEEEEDGGEEA